jgi:RNA polymerase sigma-70 factor (ECF subfamily)
MDDFPARPAADITTLRPRAVQEPSSPPGLQLLYRAHWQELCRYVNRTFGAGPPEPEDVVQIAFTRYAALDEPQRVQNPRAFLFTTVRNIVLDYRRSQDRVERYVKDALARAGEDLLDEISPERVLMERQRFDALNAAIKRLPEKQQRVLAMNRYHGMTYEAISGRTGWSLADISRQVTRAVAALDTALKETGQR